MTINYYLYRETRRYLVLEIYDHTIMKMSTKRYYLSTSGAKDIGLSIFENFELAFFSCFPRPSYFAFSLELLDTDFGKKINSTFTC